MKAAIRKETYLETKCTLSVNKQILRLNRKITLKFTFSRSVLYWASLLLTVVSCSDRFASCDRSRASFSDNSFWAASSAAVGPIM